MLTTREGGIAVEANILLNDGSKYGGKYVALRSFLEKDVISSGNNAAEVYHDAKKQGADDPVLFYVPEQGAIHIY